jgi:hypothetical protein
MRAQNAQAAFRHVHNDMTPDQIAELTTTEPKMMFEELLVYIGDSVSDLPSSDSGEDSQMRMGKI